VLYLEWKAFRTLLKAYISLKGEDSSFKSFAQSIESFRKPYRSSSKAYWIASTWKYGT